MCIVLAFERRPNAHIQYKAKHPSGFYCCLCPYLGDSPCLFVSWNHRKWKNIPNVRSPPSSVTESKSSKWNTSSCDLGDSQGFSHFVGISYHFLFWHMEKEVKWISPMWHRWQQKICSDYKPPFLYPKRTKGNFFFNFIVKSLEKSWEFSTCVMNFKDVFTWTSRAIQLVCPCRTLCPEETDVGYSW